MQCITEIILHTFKFFICTHRNGNYIYKPFADEVARRASVAVTRGIGARSGENIHVECCVIHCRGLYYFHQYLVHHHCHYY